MNEIYFKNIEYAKKYNPEIIHFLEGTDEKNLVPIKTKSGKITLEYNNILLHSKYDPDREGERFAFSSQVQNGDIVILYGFALGYHISSLIEIIGKSGILFVIEPNKEILNFVFKHIDLTYILNKSNIKLFSGWTEEDLSYLLEYEIFLNLDIRARMRQKILIYEPALKCIPEGFDKVKNFFEVMLLDKQTPAIFNKIDKDNFKNNLDTIISCPGAADVLLCVKDKPCIIVGAGPSLDQVIFYLNKYKDKMFIFVIDTALPILVKHKIMPDFVVSVDPQDDSFMHFKNNLDCDAPLIMLPTSNAKIINLYKGEKIVTFLKGHSLTKKIEKQFEHKGISSGGGCASSIILNLLIKYGAEPILLAGHDFSFPDMKFYSSNTQRVSEEWIGGFDKFNSVVMKHLFYIMNPEKKMVYVKDKFDLDIPTHQNLYSYLKSIEQIIDSTVGVNFYNIFSKGVYIKGTKDIIFQEELDSILPKKINKKIEIKKYENIKELNKEEILKDIL